MDKETENETYRITPKGVLVVNFGLQQGELIWQTLIDFAQKRLDYEEDRGIPCLVLEGGGHVISVKKNANVTTSKTFLPAPRFTWLVAPIFCATLLLNT